MIDPDASIMISQELGGSERLLWAGRPCPGIKFQGADVFLAPITLLWCGFAIFWEASAITKNAPFFFKLWGIPFVLAGMYFVFGRFVVDAKRRERVFYGVTNERIIIISTLFRRNIKTMSLRTLTDVSMTEGNGKTGTITFGAAPAFYSMFGNSSWLGMGQNTIPAFQMIENTRTVYGLISDAQKAA
jgi:hypothetical protein